MPDAVVVFDDSQFGPDTLRLRPGKNLKTGESHLRAEFGELTSMETDALTIASSIFACDLAFRRCEREGIARQINLTIPVVNLATLNDVRDDIRYALYRLSHDAWNIEFIQRSGDLEDSKEWPVCNEGKVLLFSGGLDSFAAALKFGVLGEKVHLASHITANQSVSGAQETLFQYLAQCFPDQFSRVAVRVGGNNNPGQGYPFPSPNERECTRSVHAVHIPPFQKRDGRCWCWSS